MGGAGAGRSKASRGGSLLAVVLFLAVFLNGFEAGGYQACLQSIGQEFSLNASLMGAFASVQLVAGLVAPLVFGPLADRRGKRGFLVAFLALEVVACLVCVVSQGSLAFVAGIFLLGVGVSAVQLVSLAALMDAFPQTGTRKLGYVTGMYSLGAVVSPLVCGALLGAGVSWRLFFVVLAVGAGVAVAGALASDFSPREAPVDTPAAGDARTSGAWNPAGVAALCVVMFVYVGVESGIAYFMNSYVGGELGGGSSYLALSLFWLAMIPSRLLCGTQGPRHGTILLVACVGASVLAAVFASLSSADLALVVAAVLGFFCGAVYPCVLSYNVGFAGGRTATATGLITAATGLGGAVVTTGFGWMTDALGMRAAYRALAVLMALDVIVAAVLLWRSRRGVRLAANGVDVSSPVR